MPGEAELRALLRRIDGRGYGAYRDLRGAFDVQGVSLFIDHVQGDPFAAPSRLRLRIPAREAGWPAQLTQNRLRRIAFVDFLARRAQRAVSNTKRSVRGSGKSGMIFINAPRQAVLERNTARADGDIVELRVEAGLPAAGRRVLGDEADALLSGELPALARAVLYADAEAGAAALRHADCCENHAALQRALEERGLAAFVADGALLPRESGASDKPMREGALPFHAPPELRVTLDLPHPLPGGEQCISGMGVPTGVTLIVGGGYHGKSTLLRALEAAVRPHPPGDGRESTASLPGAVKIRAEDGRSVVGCDIHGFIDDLPGGQSTRAFESADASGSTSQAAAIVEALEAGARLLLIDEDSSATNFMVRDARMQALVAGTREPITPFVDRVRELYESFGVSTVLVMGGSGDYFDVADTVIEMRDWRAFDVGPVVRRIASTMPGGRKRETRAPLAPAAPRAPLPESLDPGHGRRTRRIEARGRDEIVFGTQVIDLRGVDGLVEPAEVRAIGYALATARRFMGQGRSVAQVLDALEALLDEAGLDALDGAAGLARPRRFEISAALMRLRTLRFAKMERGA